MSSHPGGRRVEPLEGRRLLSAAVVEGVWQVRGDGAADPNDVIVIDATPGDAGTLRATVNGVVEGTTPLAGLTRVEVDAGAGNDRVSIQLPASAGAAVRVLGGSGNDRIGGSGGDEELLGDAGDDRIDGAGGNDTIDGGTGADDLLGGDGDDVLLGQKSRDVLAGGWGRDRLLGGPGGDRLGGGGDDDDLDGEGGGDRVSGGPGADLLAGGPGRDRVFRQQGVDTLGRRPAAGAEPVPEKPSRRDDTEEENVSDPTPRQRDAAGLRQWMIDAAVKQWAWAFGKPSYQWGYYYGRDGGLFVNGNGAEAGGPPPATGAPVRAPRPGAPAASPDGAGGEGTNGGATDGGSSGTNTQEQGVDEADLVENDGRYIYSLGDDELVIASAVPADDLRVVSRRAIEGSPLGIYRHGSRLTVLSGSFPYVFPLPVDVARGIGAPADASDLAIAPPLPQEKPKVTVTVLDVTDPAAPSVVEETVLDGGYHESRMIDQRLYVVVRNDTWVPPPREIPAPGPGPDPEPKPDGGGGGGGATPGGAASVIAPPGGSTSVYESEAAYRARLEAMPLEELLPSFESHAGGHATAGLLVAAPDAYVRDLEASHVAQNLTTVALLDVGDAGGGPSATSSVAGYGGTAYASADALYLTAVEWDGNGNDNVTRVMKFSLGTDAVPLVATGVVHGTPVNQFSMDEEGDFFRIATNDWGDGPGTSDSNLFVLEQTGDDLAVVGSVRGLAKGETLQSVRFVADKAYLVTFLRVDPLFTVDLSDPRRPRVAGELKIPGFSSYLHPVNDDLLIGLGRDVDPETNRDRGLQVSLFDVSNPANPRRLATHKLSDDWQSSEAEHDHHAFSYFPEQGILAIPVTHYGRGVVGGGGIIVEDSLLPEPPRQTLVVLKVDAAAGSFQALGEVEPPGNVRRTLRIGDVLYAVGPTHIQARDLDEPDKVLDTLETAG